MIEYKIIIEIIATVNNINFAEYICKIFLEITDLIVNGIQSVETPRNIE